MIVETLSRYSPKLGGQTEGVQINTNIIGKILDLFETMEEAVDYITDQTNSGNFESALVLLQDLKDAADEINQSSLILMERLKMEIKSSSCYEKLIQGINNLELAYENPSLDTMNEVLKQTIVPQLASWKADFVSNVAYKAMS